MMVRNTILLAIFLAAIPAAAQQMVTAAHQQLAAMGFGAKAEMKAETEAYAVYGTSEGGFVVMGKYADGPQVLGYSTSTYHADRLPCGLRWWLGAVGETAGSSATAPKRRASYTAVANFIDTQWGQDTPYNQKCPMDGGERTPTGCIATAMAQVMRYYEWPMQGQGMGAYTVGSSEEPIYEATNNVYQWSLMPKVPYTGSTRANIREAVSTLMFDCGKASMMNYAKDGSGAYDWDQALGLARNFQYDSLALRRLERSLYGDADWQSIIVAEMQAHRPILYSGSSEEDGGHAFVFSGLDSSGRVYVNWGWNGDCDGYYDINAIKPREGNFEIYDFTEGQSMNIGIKPMSADGPDGEYQSQWVAYFLADATVSQNRRQLRIPYYYFYNIQYLPFLGSIGLLIESTDDHGISRMLTVDDMEGETVYCYEGYSNIDDSGSRPTYTPVDISLTGMPAGYYRATWVSQAIQESVPRTIIDEEGAQVAPFYFAKSASGTISVSSLPITDGIAAATVNTGGASPARYYDMQGRPAAAGHRGVRIVRQAGRTGKVIR